MKLLIANICISVAGWILMVALGLNFLEDTADNKEKLFVSVWWTILWIGIILKWIW